MGRHIRGCVSRPWSPRKAEGDSALSYCCSMGRCGPLRSSAPPAIGGVSAGGGSVYRSPRPGVVWRDRLTAGGPEPGRSASGCGRRPGQAFARPAKPRRTTRGARLHPRDEQRPRRAIPAEPARGESEKNHDCAHDVKVVMRPATKHRRRAGRRGVSRDVPYRLSSRDP